MGLLDLLKRLFGGEDDRRGVGREYGPGLRGDELKPSCPEHRKEEVRPRATVRVESLAAKALHSGLPELPDLHALARALGITRTASPRSARPTTACGSSTSEGVARGWCWRRSRG